MKEDKPNLIVMESSTKKEKEEPNKINPLDMIVDHIKELKQGNRVHKAFLVTCFGEDTSDFDNFQMVAFNITAKDFTYISRKVELQYLLDDMG